MGTPDHRSRPEIAQPSAYVSKLLALLASRDPLDVLASTPNVIEKLVRENSQRTLQSRPFEGKWTPNEVIGHLADTEWVYGFRMRLILCEDKPSILGMDQEKWVIGQRRNDRDPSDQLAEFRALRTCNLGVWKRMRPSDLDRVGLHNERGEESLGIMLKMIAGHDLSHIDQITRYAATARWTA
ncbi:MAG: DinB family protein [Phycisphaerales bacterium]|nr:DinB family protein [Phycisphaerales bacterium]